MRSTAILPLAMLLMAAPAAAAVPQGPPRSALVTSAVLMCFARAAASDSASPRSVTIEHLDAEGDVVYGATYEVSRPAPRPAPTAESVSCRFTSRGTTPSPGSTPHDEAGARAHAANRAR